MTNGWGEPLYVPWDTGLLFNIPHSPPAVKGAIHCLALLQNPGSFLKQDVCLRPPSPQINNPQNLISGGRVEALESHYFHIPYPAAFWLLRECGRPGAGKARGCGRNLRPSARFEGEDESALYHSGVCSSRKGFRKDFFCHDSFSVINQIIRQISATITVGSARIDQI